MPDSVESRPRRRKHDRRRRRRNQERRRRCRELSGFGQTAPGSVVPARPGATPHHVTHGDTLSHAPRRQCPVVPGAIPRPGARRTARRIPPVLTIFAEIAVAELRTYPTAEALPGTAAAAGCTPPGSAAASARRKPPASAPPPSHGVMPPMRRSDAGPHDRCRRSAAAAFARNSERGGDRLLPAAIGVAVDFRDRAHMPAEIPGRRGLEPGEIERSVPQRGGSPPDREGLVGINHDLEARSDGVVAHRIRRATSCSRGRPTWILAPRKPARGRRGSAPPARRASRPAAPVV